MKRESKLPLVVTLIFLTWVIIKAYNYVQDFKRGENYLPPSAVSHTKSPEAQPQAQTLAPTPSQPDPAVDAPVEGAPTRTAEMEGPPPVQSITPNKGPQAAPAPAPSGPGPQNQPRGSRTGTTIQSHR